MSNTCELLNNIGFQKTLEDYIRVSGISERCKMITKGDVKFINRLKYRR